MKIQHITRHYVYCDEHGVRLDDDGKCVHIDHNTGGTRWHRPDILDTYVKKVVR